MANAIYDTIGLGYAKLRREDPRIAAQIHAALGDAETVLNVGAGTGSYEPVACSVTAVEPSGEMIAQRRRPCHRCVQASAEKLPFADRSFDASMAVLTVHHWTDPASGMAELRRVTKGLIVIVTYDPTHRPWLTDYLPQLAALDVEQMPAMRNYAEWLGPVSVEPLPVPHDCKDGFLHAYWRRPAAYLDPSVRSGSSSFRSIDGLDEGLSALRNDLESGLWSRRYAHLIKEDFYDAGYRLVVRREDV